MSNPDEIAIETFPTVKQRLLDLLLDENAEGTISPSDKITLEVLVAEAEELIVANSRRRIERNSDGRPYEMTQE